MSMVVMITAVVITAVMVVTTMVVTTMVVIRAIMNKVVMSMAVPIRVLTLPPRGLRASRSSPVLEVPPCRPQARPGATEVSNRMVLRFRLGLEL